MGQPPRRSFLRRTKATAPPETAEAETVTASIVSTVTNKFSRRGGTVFKGRNDIEKDAAKNETIEADKTEVQKRTRPSFGNGARRNERPQANRNFAQRRPGGANVTGTTQAPSSVSTTPRKGFSFATRRRPAPSSTTTTTTAQPTTLAEDPVEIEESLQNIGDTDGIEDPTLEQQEQKKVNKIQKRPLVALKDDSNDQNPSATNEEEATRQSKKYSSSINQNQLEDLLKLKARDQETTTEFRTTVEELNAETALAIATHQLVTAPPPNTQSFDENTKPATQTIPLYKYTSPQYNEFTDSKTPTYTQEEYPSTPTYRTTGITDFVQTTSRDAFSVSQFESPKISTTPFETTYPINTLSTKNFRQTYSTISTEAPEISSTTFDIPKTNIPSPKLSYSTTDYDSPKISSTTFLLNNPTAPNTFTITESKGYPSTDYDSTTSYNAPKVTTTFGTKGSRQLEYFTIANTYQETDDYAPKTTQEFSTNPSDFTTPTYLTPRRRYTTTPSTNIIIQDTSDPISTTTRQFTNDRTEFTTPTYVTPRRRYTTTTSNPINQETTDYTIKTRQFTDDPTEFTTPTYVTPRRRYTTTTSSNTINQETTEYTTKTNQFTNDPAEFTTPTYVTPRRRYTTTTTSNNINQETTDYTKTRQFTEDPTEFTTPNYGTPRRRYTTTTSSNTINQETTDYTTKTKQFTNDPAEFTTPAYVTPRRRYTITPTSNTITQDYFETTRNNIPTGFTSRLSTTFNTEPSGFTARTRQRISTTTEPAFTETSQTSGSSTARFRGTKYVTVPVEEHSSPGYSVSSQDPSYFTREYLLESPVTKTYDEEYQYLSPVTTVRIPPRKKVFRKKIQRRTSTTPRPTSPSVRTTTTPQPTTKPFEKVPREPVRTFRPIVNYDYYDDSEEKVVHKYVGGTKVLLHDEGTIECLDVGNFPHPSSCKKFISCARMEGESLIGWEYICPKGLSFDPVGGICNWSAGLGCEEKDV